jgi:hypothetical protein
VTRRQRIARWAVRRFRDRNPGSLLARDSHVVRRHGLGEGAIRERIATRPRGERVLHWSRRKPGGSR